MGLLDFARLKKFWEEKVKPYVQTSLEGYAKKTDLSTVATSGSYNDLTDKPEGGSAEIGDTIEVNKINFSYDGASTSTSITRDDDRLRIVSGDSISLSGGHAGSILMYGSEETIYIEGEKKSVIHTYNGGGDTKISVEDDGQDTGLITIKGRKNVSMRSDGTLHIGVSDEYGSAINFFDDDSGIEIDTNNLALGKVSQIYASSSKGSSDVSSGEVGQVLTSNGDGELYWGDAAEIGDTLEVKEIVISKSDGTSNATIKRGKGSYEPLKISNSEGVDIIAIGGTISLDANESVASILGTSKVKIHTYWSRDASIEVYSDESSEHINISSAETNIYGVNQISTINEGSGQPGQVLMTNGSTVYWGDAPSGGGVGLSMPRIRLANWYYDEVPAFVEDTKEFLSGKIVFSVNVQDGTVQEGDELQVCAVRNVFGRKKLRPILSKTITAEDLENLTKQPFLQISTDDISGNNLAQTSNKAIKSFYHTDSEDFRKPKPKYARIRRPIYVDGQEVNATFSNVVPVEILLRFVEQV